MPTRKAVLTPPHAVAGELAPDEQVLWIGRPRQGLWDGTVAQLILVAASLFGFLFFVRLFGIGLAGGEIGNPVHVGNHPLEWVLLTILVLGFGFGVWRATLYDRSIRRQTVFVLTSRRMLRQVWISNARVSWVMLKASCSVAEVGLHSLRMGKPSWVWVNGRNIADRLEGPSDYMLLHLDEPAASVFELITARL